MTLAKQFTANDDDVQVGVDAAALLFTPQEGFPAETPGAIKQALINARKMAENKPAVSPEFYVDIPSALADARSKKSTLLFHSGRYVIDEPIVLTTADSVEIKRSAKIAPSTDFIGASIFQVGTISNRAEGVFIFGGGVIDCEGNANYCIDWYHAKRSQFSSLELNGAVLSPLKFGDSEADDKTYGIIGYDVEAMNVQSENDPNSVALNFVRCTDSYFGKMRLSGYRKGVYVSPQSASIELEQVHPMGREVHGAMTHGFDINGSATLINCYSDTPFDMLSGTQDDLYGFKISDRVMASCCKVFSSAYISEDAQIDGRVIPIFFDGNTDSKFSIFRVYGGSSTRRYKCLASGDTENNSLELVQAGAASIYVTPPKEVVAPHSRTANASASGRLFEKLQRNRSACRLLILSDSETLDSTSWQRKLADYFYQYYPSHTINYHAWDSGTDDYAAPIVVGTGSGIRSLDIYAASLPGAKPQAFQGAHFANAVKNVGLCDLVIYDFGHNMVLSDGESETPFIRTPALLSLHAQVFAVNDGAGAIFIAQNPHQSANDMEEIVSATYDAAALVNADVADAHSYFSAANRDWRYYSAALTPNEAGNELFLQAIVDVFNPHGTIKAALSPLHHTFAVINDNADFSDTTSDVPNGWQLSSGVATLDTTNYVGKKGFSINLSGTASASYIRYVFSAAEKHALKGKWVTVSALVFVPEGSAITAGRIGIFTGSGNYKWSYATADGQGGFKWVSVSYLVPDDVGTLEIRLYGDTTSATSDSASFDRCTISLGRFPCDFGV